MTGAPLTPEAVARRTWRRTAVIVAIGASGTPIEPADSDLARRAFDLARLRAAYQPVALGQFLLLSAGIAGPQIPNLFDDNSFMAGFSRIICVALLVVAAAMSPVILRQTRAARRYVQAATEAAARQR
ncbi:hypothetical protein NYS52_13930 [Curtobacterium flaccumfaciens pv. flaccumfaciens]|uniref:hypothetical protein n=1 Tax=Curtobacterium poinsettiae TaxID=159612 RepID=UPI00217E49B5|nr:hypothetical protein [Curtobacterium flaccumfaciens]MCS6575631.1 hypothetical protein [Curtobacterium flaccumfaciens pv. flaccumfaciens]